MIEKKILVCCGTGTATSVQVANKLQRLLRERGINARMEHSVSRKFRGWLRGLALTRSSQRPQ